MAHEAANEVLSQTTDESVNYTTAHLYDMRARYLMEHDDEHGLQTLAHAIALHLSVGSDARATELSKAFMPDISAEMREKDGDIDAAPTRTPETV